ncbi:MAG TPA: ABC transporter substrate-binding protein [Burkholderiaceae bacterium]|nr:ABC transporter substrate-binding protein [Burkholderiaceae bacterium]
MKRLRRRQMAANDDSRLLERPCGGQFIQAGRREFIGLCARALIVAPLAGHAQRATRVYRIGYLSPNNPDDPELAAFKLGLSQLGWEEARNFVIEKRWGANEALRALAADLVASGVDVIVTISTQAALAAQQATSTLPIVMAGSSDPVENGLVTSLAHPGGNVTGLTNNPGGEFVRKLIQLLKEAAPAVSRIGVLRDSTNRAEADTFAALQAAATSLGMTAVDGDARDAAAISEVLAAVVRAGANGLYVSPNGLNNSQRKLIVDFTLAHRLPAIFGAKRFVSVGGLMSYWTDWNDLRRRSAAYVDKILKGAKPADLPVEQPTKLELIVNLKTAKTLGLTIPPSLLVRADEVIE